MIHLNCNMGHHDNCEYGANCDCKCHNVLREIIKVAEKFKNSPREEAVKRIREINWKEQLRGNIEN